MLCSLLFGGANLLGFNYTTSTEFYPSSDASEAEILGNEDKLRHYTMVFHTFVFMQVFNEINARKLGEREFNVFSGFFNNWLFLFVILLTAVVQILLVQYGNQPVRCAPLNMNQHLICIGAAAGGIPWGLFVKCVPSRWFSYVRMKEEVMTDEEEAGAFTSQLRKSFRQSKVSAQNKVGIN